MIATDAPWPEPSALIPYALRTWAKLYAPSARAFLHPSMIRVAGASTQVSRRKLGATFLPK